MSEDVELFIRVKVSSQEERERLLEANYNGMLSGIIEMWLKYGSMFAGVPATPPVQNQVVVGGEQVTGAMPQTPKRKDPEIQLKQVDTEVGQLVSVLDDEPPVKAKPRGLAGRKRMGRT